MDKNFWVWTAIILLAIGLAIMVFGDIHRQINDDSVRLSSLNGAVNICSDNSLTKALVCVSSSDEMIVTPSSNVNELQHYIDSCPNHDVKIIDAHNCVGKSFTITVNNGTYTVN